MDSPCDTVWSRSDTSRGSTRLCLSWILPIAWTIGRQRWYPARMARKKTPRPFTVIALELGNFEPITVHTHAESAESAVTKVHEWLDEQSWVDGWGITGVFPGHIWSAHDVGGSSHDV